jgi:hypothetical protein
VLVTNGPFFISPAKSNQIRQDLEGVDGHGPNLITRSRRTRRPKFIQFTHKPRNKFNRRKSDDDKSDENKTSLKYFFYSNLVQAWLSNIFNDQQGLIL